MRGVHLFCDGVDGESATRIRCTRPSADMAVIHTHNDEEVAALDDEAHALTVLEEQAREQEAEAEDVGLEEEQYALYQRIKARLLSETAKSKLDRVNQRQRDQLDWLEAAQAVLTTRETKLAQSVAELVEEEQTVGEELQELDERHSAQQRRLEQQQAAKQALAAKRQGINDKLGVLRRRCARWRWACRTWRGRGCRPRWCRR